ncbi:sigma-E factor negative regulatory protein [Halomonas sp. Bachu 37]|uniref:sigma-E factor negative regulatory protein n=1 Tax=Halomonas kashgarensis TaxID=3084920 RepID=UPI0032175CAE
MSHNARESLSALMDSESDELELRRILKSLPGDADAADTWRRYHLARSVMQRDHDVDLTTDLSAGIMARLQDEPAPGVERDDAVPARHGISFARGAGVAAAVSLMVITGVQFYSGFSGEGAGSSDMASSPEQRQVQPVNLGSSTASMPSVASNATSGAQTASVSAEMPVFEQTPFRMNNRASQSQLMNVGSSMANPTTPNQGALQLDGEQVRLLQSYLDRHAEGAAYGSGEGWLPLLRASSGSEPLGQR